MAKSTTVKAGKPTTHVTTVTPPKGGKVGIEFRQNEAGALELVVEDAETLGCIFGTDDQQLATGLTAHCLSGLSHGEADTDWGRPFMLAIVNDIAPQDAFERMLAVQMATTHMALVRAGRQLALADQVAQREAYSTSFNKLARTYATQMEAFRKHRNGGRQTVTVQHVNVSDGGQAIVGNVQNGGRGVS